MSTAWHTLVGAADLSAALEHPTTVRVFDCRFVLTDAGAGEAAYHEAHIPGAFYAHLDRDLSALAGDGGRHPLPESEDFVAWARRHGVDDDTQVVVYDDGNGAIAARLWWLFQWAGHARVALLEGGLAAWRESGLPLQSGVPDLPHAGAMTRRPSVFETRTIEAVERLSSDGAACLVDARDGARYRGEKEPFAPVAGHIPSAVSRPFVDNCDASGRFKPAAQLAEDFAGLGMGVAETVCYCGSGVTACHNILAAVHAGLAPPALFVGSWSQWVLDDSRPVATGPA